MRVGVLHVLGGRPEGGRGGERRGSRVLVGLAVRLLLMYVEGKGVGGGGLKGGWGVTLCLLLPRG